MFVARFCSTFDEKDIRTSKLRVFSSNRMECQVPDFPRGTTVKAFVALNGVEFVPCPGELVVFQSPRITEIYPNWISMHADFELCLRGVNFTTQQVSAVKVSFAYAKRVFVAPGRCVDGEIYCCVPPELLGAQSFDDTSVKLPSLSASVAAEALITASPIMVDVWLGGMHKNVR